MEVAKDKYKRGDSTTPRGGDSTTPTNHLSFGMIPEEMLLDRRLDHRDIRVFAIMTCGKRKDKAYVWMGQRLIAARARIDRRTFRRVRDKLITCGWLEIIDTAGVDRAKYHFKAPVFNVPSFGREVDAAPETDFATTPPLVTCPRCQVQCRQILKAGWCRRCNKKQDMREVLFENLPDLREVMRDEMDQRGVPDPSRQLEDLAS